MGVTGAGATTGTGAATGAGAATGRWAATGTGAAGSGAATAAGAAGSGAVATTGTTAASGGAASSGGTAGSGGAAGSRGGAGSGAITTVAAISMAGVCFSAKGSRKGSGVGAGEGSGSRLGGGLGRLMREAGRREAARCVVGSPLLGIGENREGFLDPAQESLGLAGLRERVGCERAWSIALLGLGIGLDEVGPGASGRKLQDLVVRLFGKVLQGSPAREGAKAPTRCVSGPVVASDPRWFVLPAPLLPRGSAREVDA